MLLVTTILDTAYLNTSPNQAAISLLYHDGIMDCMPCSLGQWATIPGVLNYFIPAVKSLQSCPTLWDPIDGSPPGFPIAGILQARMRECVAISFSSAWKWKVKVKSLSRVRLSATPLTAAHQAPPSMDFPGNSAGVGAVAFSAMHA